jgi:hypothetical protein
VILPKSRYLPTDPTGLYSSPNSSTLGNEAQAVALFSLATRVSSPCGRCGFFRGCLPGSDALVSFTQATMIVVVSCDICFDRNAKLIQLLKLSQRQFGKPQRRREGWSQLDEVLQRFVGPSSMTLYQMNLYFFRLFSSRSKLAVSTGTWYWQDAMWITWRGSQLTDDILDIGRCKRWNPNPLCPLHCCL